MTLERLTSLPMAYQARYCEENVWRLLAHPELEACRAWAVIVSSESHRYFALHQIAGRTGDGLVCWDYHVFAVAEETDGTRFALDLDSDLPFPCPLKRYLVETFWPLRHQQPRPLFRLMTAADYLAGLASDRSHMRKPDGSYAAPPPPWAAPGEGKPNTLMSWTDVGSNSPGGLWDLKRLCDFATGELRG